VSNKRVATILGILGVLFGAAVYFNPSETMKFNAFLNDNECKVLKDFGKPVHIIPMTSDAVTPKIKHVYGCEKIQSFLIAD